MPRAAELALVLDASGLRVFIAGGGKVAAQKLRALPRRGLASVVLADPSPSSAVMRRRGLILLRRKARFSDIDKAQLVFVATNDRAANAALAARARAKGKLVSVADAPGEGNFSLPAVAKAGELRLTISTGGASPAVSKALRSWLEGRLRGSRLLTLLSILRRRRAALKSDPGAKERLLKPLRDPRAFRRLLKP